MTSRARATERECTHPTASIIVSKNGSVDSRVVEKAQRSVVVVDVRIPGYGPESESQPFAILSLILKHITGALVNPPKPTTSSFDPSDNRPR